MIKKYQDKKWLEKNYIKKRLTTTKISELCRVDNSTIGHWLKRYIIPIRSLSEANKGVLRSENTKKKMSKGQMGKKYPERNYESKNNPNWKGGKTPLILRIRTHFLYRQWRSDVFTRDNFICQMCNDNRGGNLEAHHITLIVKILQKYEIITLQEALDCEELWNINNGITLCEKCHKKIHKGNQKCIIKNLKKVLLS